MRFPSTVLRAPSLPHQFQTYILAALGSFPKGISLGSGILLLTCPPPVATALTTALTPWSFPCSTLRLIRLSSWLLSIGPGHCWQNSMSNQRIATLHGWMTWLNASSCVCIMSQVCSTTSITLLPQGLSIPVSVLPIGKLPYPFAKNYIFLSTLASVLAHQLGW